MRPDHVKCVRLTNGSSARTWCDRAIAPLEWAFLDAGHAVQAALDRGRLLICPECAAAMREALDAGTYTP